MDEIKPDAVIQSMTAAEAFEWLYQQFLAYNRNDICWTEIRAVMLNASLLSKKFRGMEAEVPTMSEEPADAFLVAYDNAVDRSVTDRLLDQEVDDVGVDVFAAEMKEKLKFSRETKGRHGWPLCSTEELWAMLREHVEKGDIVDVANIAMMIWHVGRRADTALQKIIG